MVGTFKVEKTPLVVAQTVAHPRLESFAVVPVAVGTGRRATVAVAAVSSITTELHTVKVDASFVTPPVPDPVLVAFAAVTITIRTRLNDGGCAGTIRGGAVAAITVVRFAVEENAIILTGIAETIANPVLEFSAVVALTIGAVGVVNGTRARRAITAVIIFERCTRQAEGITVAAAKASCWACWINGDGRLRAAVCRGQSGCIWVVVSAVVRPANQVARAIAIYTAVAVALQAGGLVACAKTQKATCGAGIDARTRNTSAGSPVRRAIRVSGAASASADQTVNAVAAVTAEFGARKVGQASGAVIANAVPNSSSFGKRV